MRRSSATADAIRQMPKIYNLNYSKRGQSGQYAATQAFWPLFTQQIAVRTVLVLLGAGQYLGGGGVVGDQVAK